MNVACSPSTNLGELYQRTSLLEEKIATTFLLGMFPFSVSATSITASRYFGSCSEGGFDSFCLTAASALNFGCGRGLTVRTLPVTTASAAVTCSGNTFSPTTSSAKEFASNVLKANAVAFVLPTASTVMASPYWTPLV